MIADVGNIIINKLVTLPFIDKYAGVVRVIKYKQKDGIIGSFPADCKISLDECNKGKRYLDLVPDSKKKSVLYLEDLGLRQTDKKGTIQYFNAQYNLVGWLNLALLGVNSCSYSAAAIGSIFKRLNIAQFNEHIYQYIDIKIIGQQPKSLDPFVKYSYDETINQYLMFPYDHFVISIDVNFRFDTRCIKENSLDPANYCLVK